MTATLRTTIIQEPSSATANMTLDTSGGVAFGNAIQVGGSAGTSGQYLKSNGSGASPSWATLSATGALIRAPQILTSGTSYTTPSNCTAIFVELWGGGAAGGGVNASSQRMGGGGSGAYLAKYITVTASTAYTIAIGSGGTGTSSTTGASGGNTTITVGATTYTAGGGGGGSNLTGGTGGTATNGDINISGMPGNPGSNTNNGQSAAYPLGVGYDGNISSTFAGCGGSIVGPWFTANGGLGKRTTEGAGGSASFYSGGGGGAVSGGSTFSGGSGTQGVMRIWEFT